MNKVIIIGYGPAGITAAIYLKRTGIDALVIGKDLGALDGYTDLVENYYGFSKPLEGKKLIQEGVDQAKKLGIEVITDSVIFLLKPSLPKVCFKHTQNVFQDIPETPN